MHNIKLLRENINDFKKKLSNRNFDFNVKEFEDLDKYNRKLISQREKLEQEKKILSKSKDKSNFEKSKSISEEITKLSGEQINIQNKLNKILHFLPNLALEDVPVGKDEKTNKLLDQFGTVKKFKFKPRSHIELGLKNKQIDFDTSIKLSGSRFVVLRDKIALLERALINFMLDTHTTEFDYTEISPPLIVNEDVMFGTGQIPKFEDDQFEIKFENSEQRKFLIPTAEVSLTNLSGLLNPSRVWPAESCLSTIFCIKCIDALCISIIGETAESLVLIINCISKDFIPDPILLVSFAGLATTL